MTRKAKLKAKATKVRTYETGGLAGLPKSKWASVFERAAEALDVENSGRAADLLRTLPREARRTAEWDAIADAVWRYEGTIIEEEG